LISDVSREREAFLHDIWGNVLWFVVSAVLRAYLRACLAGFRLLRKRLRLWLLWWSGFLDGAGAVLKKRLAKQLHLLD
jgi:hypothetical protein